MRKLCVIVLALMAFGQIALAAEAGAPLPDTAALDWEGDLSLKMREGVHRFLDRRTEAAVVARERHWRRDASSRAAYEKSVEPNRRRFREIVGVVDERSAVRMERFGDDERPALVAETEAFTVHQVRWPVLDGVWGEGLLLTPKQMIRGYAVALPDADQTPEQFAGLAHGLSDEAQFARRLAEQGFQVVAPVLISRAAEFSGRLRRVDKPHREWIHLQAFEMGRHVIGYEVQKVMAAVDWFRRRAGPKAKVAVAGYGEGGLIAFYAAAADQRIDACLVSGYFDSRQGLWREPLYRNAWGLLREFGDAEIASLIAPRALVVEHAVAPSVTQYHGAPGELATATFVSVQKEFERIDEFAPAEIQPRRLLHTPDGRPFQPGFSNCFTALQTFLGFEPAAAAPAISAKIIPRTFDPAARQRRQVWQLTDHIQRMQRTSDAARYRFFQPSMKSLDAFVKDTAPLKTRFYDEVIGRIDEPLLPANPRSRQIYDEEKWTGYEVVLDVWPDVFAWGILCVPKDLKPGERRPVVVCQHGLEGLPRHTIEKGEGHHAYKSFAARLTERGFVTFAPHNLYRGGDHFRLIQRKANPLKASLFSIIVPQHEQILNWLETLPFVDRQRMAFYGLSYGGKTAMRVPPLVDRYCLSICSADFNDWVRKITSVDHRCSYMYTKEWEIPEWNLGHTFNYAEMAQLMIPRPFMVERGHDDGVAPDEWVAYEYAKVRRVYNKLGLGDRTAIEFFDGPHTINGQGTFEFLHQHLSWPAPE